MAYILSLQESDHIFLVFPNLCPNRFFLSWSCEVVLGNFLHSEQFIGGIITPAFRIYLHFCQKYTQNSHKLSVTHTFCCGNGSLVVPWSAIYGSQYLLTNSRLKKSLAQEIWMSLLLGCCLLFVRCNGIVCSLQRAITTLPLPL